MWGQHEIPEDSSHTWEIGPLKIWCKNINKELQIAYNHNESNEAEGTKLIEPPEDLTWTRWALEEKQNTVELNPVLPDRPVVVRPETSFWLTKNAKARIYVRIPLWIQINLAGRKTNALTEIPIVILSNTWFGNFFEGELCYWISSGARRQIEVDPQRTYLVICPIQLINNSDEDLLVEKICLRVMNLSLFDEVGQLWSDEIRISYEGKKEGSQIKASGKSPSEAKSAKLISLPREPIKHSLTAKTFASILELSGFGLSRF
jgi:hypothetical protein